MRMQFMFQLTGTCRFRTVTFEILECLSALYMFTELMFDAFFRFRLAIEIIFLTVTPPYTLLICLVVARRSSAFDTGSSFEIN